MKKITSKILIAAVGLVTLSSCSNDYLDVNKNANDAYSSSLSPKERLGAAETQIYRTQAGIVNRFGNVMMNAWAGNNYYYAGPFQEEYRMDAISTFYNGIWDGYYQGISNYNTIITIPNADKNYTRHVAISRIMKSFYMQTIVDLYNDVPYSEAFQRQANLTPKYDKGQDVYKALVADLNLAITQLTLGVTPAPPAVTAAEDPIFGGVLANWKKFANTVKLRILVRLSKTTDPAMVTLRNQLITELQTLGPADYVTADVLISPPYGNANADNQNPLWRNFGLVDINTGQVNSNYRLIVASKHIIDNMRGLAPRTTGLSDPRVGRMFTNNGFYQVGLADYSGTPGYKGIEQGAPKDQSLLEGDFTTLGPKMFFITSSATGSAQPGIIMSNAESQFLQAEAAVTYPALASLDAQSRFNEGITSNFTFLGATNVATYIANANAKPGIGWTASTNKIEAIQYQKWIALTNINPLETYISYTKTGFPVTPMPIGSNHTSRPVRLMYPQSEYLANGSNVPNPSLAEMYSPTSQYAPFWLK